MSCHSNDNESQARNRTDPTYTHNDHVLVVLIEHGGSDHLYVPSVRESSSRDGIWHTYPVLSAGSLWS